MTGRTHIISAVVFGLAVTAKYDLPVGYLVPCIIGGLWPDTDHRKSILGRWIPLWLLPCFRPHRRNVLHSFRGSLYFSIPWLFDWRAALFFWMGYMSHLFLDTFNQLGVRWFYPSKRMISVASIQTGGIGEFFVAFGWYCLVVYVVGSL